MGKLKVAVTLMLMLIFSLPLVSCGETTESVTTVAQITDTLRPQPSPSPSPTALPYTTPSVSSNDSQAYCSRIQISTTSDWSSLRLVGGARWHDFHLISTSDQLFESGLDEGNSLWLKQSPDQAKSASQVELVAEVNFSELTSGIPLVFEIERGYIGATQVELSRCGEEISEPLAVLTWDGTTPGYRNVQYYEVSAEPFLGAALNEYITIAQINFWYPGGFEDAAGNRFTSLTPLLGETYSASDRAVVYQQIEWAVEYGVDAFSIEWTTPRGVGCCESMEDTLDDVFLKSSNINKVRWAIFYDFPLRLDQTEGLKIYNVPYINFDEPDVYDTFVYDFTRFAEKYFSHPQYLKIDERPVVYIWATNSFIGNLAGAVQEARDRVAELGFDVFIVGDEVCYGCFNREHAALFDGSSTFTMLIPGIDAYALDDVGEAAIAVDEVFKQWRDQLRGLKVAGREELVNFQPAWAPQFDNRFGEGVQNPIYVPALSKDQVTQMAMVARKHAEPVGGSNIKLIWLNTWNCWAETTTFEPTANLGPKYPAGNYQFDMLEVVREVFGSETYYTSPLP